MYTHILKIAFCIAKRTVSILYPHNHVFLNKNQSFTSRHCCVVNFSYLNKSFEVYKSESQRVSVKQSDAVFRLLGVFHDFLYGVNSQKCHGKFLGLSISRYCLATYVYKSRVSLKLILKILKSAALVLCANKNTYKFI